MYPPYPSIYPPIPITILCTHDNPGPHPHLPHLLSLTSPMPLLNHYFFPFAMLRKERRRAQRFFYLVECCQPPAAANSASDTSSARWHLVVAQVQVVASTLMLVNALINSPAELATRVAIRSEFMRLSLLELLPVSS